MIDGLPAYYKKLEDVIDENGLLKELTKIQAARPLNTEMTEYLSDEKTNP